MQIEYEVIAPDGSVHHTSRFNVLMTDERRAFAERILDAQMQGFEIRSWRAGNRPIDQAKAVCAEAYLVVGSLLSDVGQFDSGHGEKVLDNLSQARRVHDEVLPWPAMPPVDRERYLDALDDLWKVRGGDNYDPIYQKFLAFTPPAEANG